MRRWDNSNVLASVMPKWCLLDNSKCCMVNVFLTAALYNNLCMTTLLLIIT